MSAATELRVLISVLQEGTGLKTLLADTNDLARGLRRLNGEPLTDASKAAEKFTDSQRNAAKATDFLENAVQKTMRAIRFLAGGFLAFESIRFLKDIADTAARAEVLGTVLHVVGNNAGYTNKQLDELDSQVQRLGISASASRQSLVQMIQAGLDPALAVGPKGLARAAQDLAVIGNINSSEAFERLISGIQRHNTQSLRTLGITISNERAQQRLAQSLHKTVGELSEMQQTQALASEVMREAARLTGTYERAMGDVGKMLTTLPRLTEQLSVAVGSRLLPVYRVLIDEYSNLLKNLTNLALAQEASADATDSFVEAIRTLAQFLSQLVFFVAEHSTAVLRLVTAYGLWKIAVVSFKIGKGLADLEEKIIDIASGLKKAITWTYAFITGTRAATVATTTHGAALQVTAAMQLSGVYATGLATTALEANAVAANAAALAIGKVALAWGVISAVLAIPAIGYIIYKRREDNAEIAKKSGVDQYVDAEEGNRRAWYAKRTMDQRNDMVNGYRKWMADHPLEVAAQQARPEGLTLEQPNFTFDYLSDNRKNPMGLHGVSELQKKFLKETQDAAENRLKAKQGSALEEQETQLTQLTASYEKLKKTAEESGLVLDVKNAESAKKIRDHAEAVRDELRVTMEGNTVEAQRELAVDRVATALANESKAVSKLLAVQKDATSTPEQLAKAKAEYNQVVALRKTADDARATTNIKTGANQDVIRAQDEEVARLRLERLQRETQDQLEKGELSLFPDVAFSGVEGRTGTGKEFSKQLGYLRNELEALGKEGDNTAERILKIREGIETVRNTAGQKQEIPDLDSALNDINAKLKVTPGVTATERAQVLKSSEQARQQARQQVDDKERARTAKTTAYNRANIEADNSAKAAGFQRELEILQTRNDAVNLLENEHYALGQKRVKAFYDTQAAQIEAEGHKEIEVLTEQLREATEIYKKFRGSVDAPAAKRLKEEVTAAQGKLDITRGKDKEHPDLPPGKIERDIAVLRVKERADERQAAQAVLQLHEDVATFYGGEKAAAEQIANRFREMALNMKDAAGKSEELFAAQHVQQFQSHLAFVNQALEVELRLRNSLLSLARARVQVAVDRGELTDVEGLRAQNQLVQDELDLKRVEITKKKEELAQLNTSKVEQEAVLAQKFLNDGLRGVALEAAITEGLTGASEKITTATSDLNDLQTAFVELQQQTIRYGDELRRVFSDSLATAIADSFKGAKAAGEGFLNFAKSLRDQVTGTIAKNLSGRITASLINATSEKKLDKDGNKTNENIPGTSAFERVFKFLKLDTDKKKAPLGSEEDPFTVKIKPNVTTSVPNFSSDQGVFDLGPVNPAQFGGASATQEIKQALSSTSFGTDFAKFSGLAPLVKTLISVFNRPQYNPAGGISAGGVSIPFFGYDKGGMVEGPGTGTSDSIVARVSAGEHIMPADKTQQWLPILEAMRSGKLKAYAAGGLVAVQSIAIAPIIARRYVGGGVVAPADAGAPNVIPGSGGPQNMMVQLHPDALNLTMREWLEHEVARQQGQR